MAASWSKRWLEHRAHNWWRAHETDYRPPTTNGPLLRGTGSSPSKGAHHGAAAAVRVLPLPCDPAADVTVAGVLLPSGVAYRPTAAGVDSTTTTPPLTCLCITLHADRARM